MPGGWPSMRKTSLDWCYDTVPQKGCNNRIISVPRGRLLGGCSANNFTLVTRGTKADYDRIAAMGNPGWSWEEMLPFFKASETFHPAEWHQSDLNIRGTDGPLHIAMNPLAPISEKILESFIDSGFDYKPDMFVQGHYEGSLYFFLQ
jgi:choline dehydrogenase-like flavoprotein